MSMTISVSGLNAATRRLDAAAFDIARASAQRVGQPVAAPPGGTAGPAQPPAAAPQPPAQPQPAAIAQPVAEDPDLPRAMVDMIGASNAALANLQAIRRQNESLDAVLNLR
jgi:flagellar basal body rod protein FlgC